MDFVNRSLICLGVVAVSFAAVASPVSIDARGGVVPDDDEAEVSIATAAGGEDGVALEKTSVSVSSLTQAQSVQDAVVKMGQDESLAVQRVAVAAGAKDLQLGDVAGQGFVTNASSDALEFEIADEDSAIVLNANLLLGSRSVALLGLGSVKSSGAFCGSVSHQGSGTMRYAHGTFWFSVSGEGALYDYASDEGYASSMSGVPSQTATLKSEETVLRSSSSIPVVCFRVDGGTSLRVVDTMVTHPVVADYAESYLATVPSCGMVGSNSIGVVSFDGGGYVGKLVVAKGGDDFAEGAVYLHDGAYVRNICSTDGEELLGCNGYAFLGIDGGSTYLADGLWIGGSGRQFGIVITNGVFAHQSERTSGLKLGNGDGDVWLYVGRGGRFDCLGASAGVQIPASDVNPSSVQITVTDGGVIDLGDNEIESDGGVIYNLNDGGALRTAAIHNPKLVQFDGGTLAITKSVKQLFEGEVLVCSKGAFIDVPEGCTAIVPAAYPLKAATAGLLSAKTNSVLAGMTFIGPPAARVTGGGKGATAVCEFDAASRKVSGIRITGQGYGYTTAQVGIYYGGAKVTDLTGNVGKRVSGGLTKTGDGTLVLNAGNTYAGVTSVNGGVLKLASASSVLSASGLSLATGGVIDLGGYHHTFASYSNDGTGSVTNGTAEVGGLSIDMNKVLVGLYDKLVMTNLSFTASSSLKLLNADEKKLDRNAEYVLCEFVDGAPERFPVTDQSSYENLSETWGVVVKGDKAVLKYLGGSIYLFY